MARTVSRVVSLACTLAVLALAGFPGEAHAQWAAGASYQFQDASPAQGGALYLQRTFATGAPRLNLFLRGRAAYLPRQEERSTGIIDYASVTTARGYDVAMGGGLEAVWGRVHPYAGVGTGFARRVGQHKYWQGPAGVSVGWTYSDLDAASFYLSSFLGLYVEIFDRVRPFVEYGRPFPLGDSPPAVGRGRLAAGVSIQF